MRDASDATLSDAVIAIDGTTIAWAGAAADLPEKYSTWEQRSLDGRLVTPGLIDCHTHLVYGGNRAREFAMRLEGTRYEDIARAGGGINSTVSATRAASEEELLKEALARADVLLAEGVTTLEIKSGYGLNQDTELRMLRVARAIAAQRDVTVQTSYLGAHAIPGEYRDQPDAYLSDVVVPTLAVAAQEGLVDAVDGFCETIAFTPAQIAQVFDAAKAHGLPVKLHAEQLSHMGGAKLCAEYGGLSADHVEYATEEDAQAMAAAGTVAVLLPGAFYTLRETQTPPVEAFRAYGVPMALATDSNPGSSPLTSLLLAMNMGCTLFRLTPSEALAGVTCHAAKALGLTDRGHIAEGLRADLAVWDAYEPAELSYRIGYNPLHARIVGGRLCH